MRAGSSLFSACEALSARPFIVSVNLSRIDFSFGFPWAMAPLVAGCRSQPAQVARVPARRSLPELKPLEAMQLFLDAALQRAPRLALGLLAQADPIPFLHQELFVLPVSLEIERGDDVLSDQHGQREVTELALLLRHIGL